MLAKISQFLKWFLRQCVEAFLDLTAQGWIGKVLGGIGAGFAGWIISPVGMASAVVVGAVVFFLVSVGVNQWKLHRQPFNSASDSGWISSEAQAKLRQRLEDCRGDQTHVSILVASMEQMPLGKILQSVFSIAGWQSDLTSVPLETYIHKYHVGVEVLGYSPFLVQAVSEAMSQVGLTEEIRQIVGTHKVRKSNPKWRHVEQGIQITIGH